jgi:hypothetical protein
VGSAPALHAAAVSVVDEDCAEHAVNEIATSSNDVPNAILETLRIIYLSSGD